MIYLLISVVLFSCKPKDESRKPTKQVSTVESKSEMKKNLNKYVSVKLTSDLSKLTENERKMLPLLIKAANKMNDLFWYDLMVIKMLC